LFISGNLTFYSKSINTYAYAMLVILICTSGLSRDAGMDLSQTSPIVNKKPEKWNKYFYSLFDVPPI
jgi:hypothetical protein